jgi:hypothetical protein
MEELLRHRLLSLTTEHRDFVLGEYIPKVTERFSSAENFTDEQATAFTVQLKLFALAFYTTDELVNVLADELRIEPNQSELLVSSVLNAFPDEYIIAQEQFKKYIESEIFFDPRLKVIAETHKITDETNQIKLSEIVQNVAFDNVQQSRLPRLLQAEINIDQATAMRMTGDILDFLDTPQPQGSTNISSVANQQESRPTEQSLAAELAETEAAFKQLQPIRTMAHDMETLKQVEEPVYQATDQETILNGQGNAQKNVSAQWGTPEK